MKFFCTLSITHFYQFVNTQFRIIFVHILFFYVYLYSVAKPLFWLLKECIKNKDRRKNLRCNLKIRLKISFLFREDSQQTLQEYRQVQQAQHLLRNESDLQALKDLTLSLIHI